MTASYKSTKLPPPVPGKNGVCRRCKGEGRYVSKDGRYRVLLFCQCEAGKAKYATEVPR